ncbi:MAG: helix-turn-helix transcriptional regulator [Acetatifactor sp.]|nr:helix-turn-helix transcriptional regulator [Acetatifactor sp.]
MCPSFFQVKAPTDTVYQKVLFFTLFFLIFKRKSYTISLVDVANSVNICKEECCRFFKKYMNTTIIEYQMSLRIQNSLPLLKRGESITHIAGEMGFGSPAYYTQIFKRYMKCTPKEYAKRTGTGK